MTKRTTKTTKPSETAQGAPHSICSFEVRHQPRTVVLLFDEVWGETAVVVGDRPV